MPRLGRFARELRARLWKPSVEEEVRRELDYHLEMLEQDASDSYGEARPLFRFDREPLSPGIGQLVQLDLALGIREPPLGLDPAFSLEAVERRVEGPLLDAEGVGAGGLDPLCYGVAVAGPPGEGLENERVEGAVEEFGRFGHENALII